MRFLLALILLAGSVKAATISNYSPTAMKVAVGSFYCNVYFHWPGIKWDFEMACYDQGGANTYIQVNTPFSALRQEGSVTFPDNSSVAWLLVANPDGTYTYQITGADSMSAVPVLVQGTL